MELLKVSCFASTRGAPAMPAYRRPAPLPVLPCRLPYGPDGQWSAVTTKAARQCVIRNLERDLKWWQEHRGAKENQRCAARRPDVDGTICRMRLHGQRAMLTNTMLLRSSNGRLSATILLDPGDERGPMRHWPARPVAALQQLTQVQGLIDAGRLAPLPDFTAILNPHDKPQQFARVDWCGLVPLISNCMQLSTFRGATKLTTRSDA